MTNRKTSVAGSFYPNNPTVLKNEISSFLSRTKKKSHQKVKFLVVPHAGYFYSGQTAGESFVEIQNHNYKKIILLGPSHRHRFNAIAESGFQKWESPLGLMSVDESRGGRIIQEPNYHRLEHSLEVQIPFLKYLLPDTPIIPLLLSGATTNANEFSDILIDYDDINTLWVISSDFNHTGPSFGHYPREFGYSSGEEMDAEALKLISKGSPKPFIDFLEKTNSTICGALPILVTMLLINKLKHQPLIFKSYDCSSRLTGDSDSVGYGAMFC